jgi:16S rRNA (guanine(966)-N(2))-methyltransferase RsmD
MRIIAGRFKGRRLSGPAVAGIRPTSDRLRETLFNVLGGSLDGPRVLDAYAGTGALGLEALSRGAASVTFVERDRATLKVLEANIAACRAEEACMIVRGDFLDPRNTARHPSMTASAFDLVLLDPPYEADRAPEILTLASGYVAPGGRLVYEHARRRPSPEHAGALRRHRVIEAGDSALSFYAAPTT